MGLLNGIYGNPTKLRRLQEEKLRELPEVGNTAAEVTSFVIKASGLVAALAADPEQDMRGIIDMVVEKLPLERRLAGASFASSFNDRVTADQFLVWLRDLQAMFAVALSLIHI